MSTVADSLVQEITLALSRARLEHTQAVVQRLRKDTPANRALVAEWSARIDSLLDMYLVTGGSGSPAVPIAGTDPAGESALIRSSIPGQADPASAA